MIIKAIVRVIVIKIKNPLRIMKLLIEREKILSINIDIKNNFFFSLKMIMIKRNNFLKTMNKKHIFFFN